MPSHTRLHVSHVTIITALCLIMTYNPVFAQNFSDIETEKKGLGFSASYSILNAIHYNRTEGLFLGGGIALTNDYFPGATLFTMGGYGLESNKWRYCAMLEYAFDLFRYKTLSFSYFDETRSNDMETVGDMENNLAALFFHKDYRDYYRIRGFEGKLEYSYKEKFRTTISAGRREYFSMDNMTNWSIFNKDKTFRTNPPLNEGIEALASIKFYFNNRENIYVEANYWEFEAAFEREFNDYTFTGLHAGLKRTQLGFGSQTLIASATGSIRIGTAAEQYLFDLGGIGTLRGYGFKEYSGNTRLMFDAEYQFNGDILQKIPLQKIPFYSSLALSLFYDAGLAWFSNDEKEISDNPGLYSIYSSYKETGNGIDDIKSSVGASLYIFNKMLRLDFARRLDTDRNPWKVTLRLTWGKL